MSSKRATVEQIVETLFYKIFQRSKEDLYIDNIKEFFIKFSKFTYSLSLNELTVKELDDSTNGFRIDDIITIYLNTEEVSNKITFIINMGKTIVIKTSIFVSSDLFKEITTYSFIDEDTPLKYTIIPGVAFSESNKAREYINKIYQEHVLQIPERFSIEKFTTDISSIYQIVSTTIFTYGVIYITNLYKKSVNQKDIDIITAFPRNVSIDELSIKRNDYAIRIYGNDLIIGDQSQCYCKVGFVEYYPGNIYHQRVINPYINIETSYSEFMVFLFRSIKLLIDKDHKRNAYINTIFTKLLEMSQEKNTKEVQNNEQENTELNESIYFAHITNKIKELFKCETVNDKLISTLTITDTTTVYSCIEKLINDGFYNNIYRDINTNIKYLISIYRRNKSSTTPSVMIILVMNTENVIKFYKCIPFKTKRYPREGCQFVICGDMNNSSISTRNTFVYDFSFYIPESIDTFKIFTRKLDADIDVDKLFTYTHEKGKRDPVIVAQEVTVTDTVKYLISKCYCGERFEVIGLFDSIY